MIARSLWTIGHSNHPLPEFLARLRAHQVELLVDVRTVPKSRYNPQFNLDALPGSLARQGIRHEHLPGLGGLRHARADSVNTGWRNLSFRGYADYMQTPEFAQNLDALLDLSAHGRTVIMCAEAVPWRCHRSLIADALTIRGIAVFHIMTGQTANPHKLTSFAEVDGHKITYPGADLTLFAR